MASQAALSCEGGGGDILVNGRMDGGPSGNPPTTDDAVAVIEDRGLSRSDGTKGLLGADDGGVILPCNYFGRVS